MVFFLNYLFKHQLRYFSNWLFWKKKNYYIKKNYKKKHTSNIKSYSQIVIKKILIVVRVHGPDGHPTEKIAFCVEI
jgi:hypothetical protein